MNRVLRFCAPAFTLVLAPFVVGAPIQADPAGGESNASRDQSRSVIIDGSFGTTLLIRSGPDTLMHTDVPELPEGRVPLVPGDLSNQGPSGWVPGHLSPGKKVVHQLDDDAEIVRRVIAESVDLIWPQGDGPGRVHTDVPDLPDIIIPSTSADPFRKPGWGDLSHVIDRPGRPILERSIVPAPSPILVVGISGLVALRRRRRSL